ncbi:unnamed protein product, partial [Brassica oleracea]
IEAHRFTLLSGAEGARARRRRDSPLHLRVTAVSPSIFIVCVFACCLASVLLCAFSVTTHLARRLIVISSARICVAVSPLRVWVRVGSLQSVSKLTGSVQLFVTMAMPSLIRAKSLPPPSDLSLTSPNLVSRRRASPTGLFRRRDRPITTATTTPCALCLCFSSVLILKPGSPSVTPSQPPQDSKYSVLSPFLTRLTGLTTTAPSDDASCSDGALGAIICQRKPLILVGLMGLGLTTRSSATNLFSKRYICFHSWTWAVCITKITESMLSTGSPSRPLPLVYRPSPNPKVLSCGLLPQFPPPVSIRFVVSISIMELEMMLDLSGSPGVSLDLLSDVYEILIVFLEITDGDRAVCLLNYLASSRCSLGCSAPSQTHSLGCINVVYDYGKLFGTFVSGIQVKISQGFLHIELASPTNISILCFSVLFVVHLIVEINSGFIV